MAAAATSRSLAVFKRAASSAAQILRQQHFSSAAAAAIRQPWDFYCDDNEGEESAVYQHTLKFQRPVMLKMWDEIAEVSMEHLKPYDLVYVRGHLGSYTKADENGKHRMRYQIPYTGHPNSLHVLETWAFVKEINFVTPDVQASAAPKFEKKESGGEDEQEKYRNRILLWQIFFSNPYEWMDFRKAGVVLWPLYEYTSDVPL
ncbi:Single-strand binding protein [Datura stramonium]|uniref:Single-strand binding protein n=1 Tax=Datura stramonium TaxID=4076 RepID=A0ABS8SNQ6_DATST|nr:Single-strand binding protein [Datura stramonium]